VKKLIREAQAFKESGEKGEFKAQVSGAFYKEGLGDIDLVWGDENFGLKHILERRTQDFIEKGFSKAEAEQKALEFVESLPDIIENGNIDKGAKRVFLDTENERAVIALDYNGIDRKWVLTGYIKDDKAPISAYPHQNKLTDSTSSPIVKSALTNEIIPQQSKKRALKTTTREIEKFMQLAQDLQNKSLSKNDKIQIIDNLVSALSSLEHKMPEFIEEIMEKANKATMPYASSVDRAKYKGFNASDKYAMFEVFRVIKLLDAYDDAEKLIKDIKKGEDIDFNNKILTKMQNTEKALVLTQNQASLGVIKDFEKVLKNHEQDVNLLIDKALKLLGDKKIQNAEPERDLTKLKEAKGSEDITFFDTKGRERTLTKETQKAWLETFGLESLDEEFIPNLPRELKEALGKELKLTKGSLYKIVEKGREKYIPQIKQTLQNPDFALRDRDNMLILAKQIEDKQYFTSINLETKDYFISISNAPKKENILKNKVENGAKILYQSPNAKSIFYTDTLLQTDRSSANKIDEDIIAEKNDALSEVVDNYEHFYQRYGGSLDGSLYLDDFKALSKDEQREFSHILYTFRNYLNQYD
ncbi:PBECR2 nuclease fold domain-containing protein, partial [Campylobacter felis]|uniref:putative barnase/colicin E5 family endoribonuclease n=1 Tax=Campylobacter felis TaxID=2974565 RepID=UPI002561DB68